MSQLELGGKRALVIGAGTVVGRAIALALAGAGADVAVASATTGGEEVMAARRTRRGVEALGRRTAEYAFDTTLGQNVQVSMRQVTKELGGLDILVNAQDAPLRKPAEKTSDSEWARTLALNLGGVFAACRAAAREMATEGGCILNVTPGLSRDTLIEAAAYAAARYGLLGMSRALGLEYGERGIRVNALVIVAPADSPGDDARERGHAPDGSVPASALGLPGELGALVVHLASDVGKAVTGQVLSVSGFSPPTA